MKCETCGNLMDHTAWRDIYYCVECRRYHDGRPWPAVKVRFFDPEFADEFGPLDAISRRLRDGFALLHAAENEDIDPNEHI